jgi:long-chain fatty acid transport protein
VNGLRSLAGALLASVVVLAAASPAAASGFAALGYMPDYYTPVTTTPVASYTNPAALRARPGLRWFAEFSLTYRVGSYDRAVSDAPEPADAKGANIGKAQLHNWGTIPLLSGAVQLGDFTLGLGMFGPFGGDASWDKNKKFKNHPEYVGAVDSTARWQGISGTWATIYLTAALAYQVPHTGLSLGVSGNAVRSQITLAQAVTATLDDNVKNEGRLHGDMTGWTGSFGLGLHWEALDQQRLVFGLSYQSPPGGWGNGLHHEGTLRTNFGTGVNKDHVSFDQTYPDIIQAGLRTRPIPQMELRLSGNYVRNSVVRGQCLARKKGACKVQDDGTVDSADGVVFNYVRRWHDSGGVRLAGSYFVREVHEVFASVMWDGSAVPDSTLEPGLLDGNDVGFNVGSNLRLAKTLQLGVSYMFLYMLPRDNRGKSIISDFKAPNHVPSADGQYTANVSIFNLNLTGHYDL